ncbi:GNAT family N-acetyltransferase [Pseudoalteromonas luteoviolacea]|nr:GNAT family N-acetyltransferase [Pseudoalteromonas luteoviolacea]
MNDMLNSPSLQRGRVEGAKKQDCSFDTSLWPDSPQGANTVESWLNQAWLNTYTKMILACCHDIIREQYLDTSKSLYIVFPHTAAYQFGLSLLYKLLDSMDSQGLKEVNVCCLFASYNSKYSDKLSQHPDFSHFYKNGHAKIIAWDFYSDKEFPQKCIEGEFLDLSANPGIFIANGLFSQLPQHLCKFHGQALYQAEFQLLQQDKAIEKSEFESKSNPEMPMFWNIRKENKAALTTTNKDETQSIECKWQLRDKSEITNNLSPGLSVCLNEALEQRMNEGAIKTFSLPLEVVSILETVNLAFPKGSLSLLSDFAQQRGLTLTCPLTENTMVLPLDFELVEQLTSHIGHGYTVQFPFGQKALHVLFSQNYKNDDFLLTRYQLEQCCLLKSPDSAEYVIDSLHGAAKVLTERQIRAHIVQSEYDPKVLAIFLSRLISEGITLQHRLEWCDLLNRVWGNYIILLDHDAFGFDLGLLAIDVGHWALAKSCFLTCMQSCGPSTACLHNFAVAAFATGELLTAKQSLDLALTLSPTDKQSKRLASDIDAYELRWTNLDWCDLSAEIEKHNETVALKVVPLGEHHLAEYYLQYRKPEISESLRGDKFESFEQLQARWLSWLEEGNSNKKAHFAIVHEAVGFVGGIVVDFLPSNHAIQDESIVSYEHSLHLSFWIGCDYQQKGFGKSSVALVIQYLRNSIVYQNYTHIVTSAWAHNTASRKILRQLGFKELQKTQHEGVKREVFYSLQLQSE